MRAFNLFRPRIDTISLVPRLKDPRNGRDVVRWRTAFYCKAVISLRNSSRLATNTFFFKISQFLLVSIVALVVSAFYLSCTNCMLIYMNLQISFSSISLL